MSDDLQRLRQLLQQGTCCSAALVQVAFEARGEANEPLVQAMRGLCGGVQQGLVCGALTGGACALSVLAPLEGPACMVPDLAAWFEAEAKQAYGGVDCSAIVAGDPLLKAQRCPALVEATWIQMKAILADYGQPLSWEGGAPSPSGGATPSAGLG